MRTFNLKNLLAMSALGLFAVLGTSEFASAQGNRNGDQRQEQKNARDREKADQKRIKAEQKRQADLDRQAARNANWRRHDYNNNQSTVTVTHYRVNRNGSYYNTDQRGAQLLREAVNSGYQQGYEAGRNDRSGRRRSSYSNSSGYQSGNYGYQSYVDQNQYQYYFRQGFQRGYQDGYNSRYQYGSNNGGSVNILGAILGTILNIQSY